MPANVQEMPIDDCIDGENYFKGMQNKHSRTSTSILSTISDESFHRSKFQLKSFKSRSNIDVAFEESRHWFSTEDEDFVTPWYTHLVRLLMVPTGVSILYYIYGRFAYFTSSGMLWYDICAWLFIFCESFCFLLTTTQWVWMWNVKFRKKITQSDINLFDDELPTIDIMIPCYTEPPELVQMTLSACYHIDYPSEKIAVYICDDANNVLIKEMVCETSKQYRGGMKTRYIARKKTPGVPHHAKAGNLNNCIFNEASTGDLIIVLDCDMIPEPTIARTVVPYFYKIVKHQIDVEAPSYATMLDEKVGLLQTPQYFYNLDHDDLLGQSYSYLYDIIFSGWDGSGGAPCCGTNVTFSRKSLEAVGGFSYGSITEDMKTSMNICAAGFKCKFLIQRLAHGVSPKELNGFMIQRLRWAVGAIQILKNQNPLFVKGLPLRMRWLYFFTTIQLVNVVPLTFMFIIMYGSVLGGFPVSFVPSSFKIYVAQLLITISLVMAMQFFIAWRLKFSEFMRIMQDNFTLFYLYMRAMLIGFFGFKLEFACTKKDVLFDFKENFHHAIPHIVVYIVSTITVIKATCELLENSGYISLPWSSDFEPTLLYLPIAYTVFLWILISCPLRMIYYWHKKSARIQKSAIQGLNRNVPVLQEISSTPVNIFPPLSPEISMRRVTMALTDPEKD